MRCTITSKGAEALCGSDFGSDPATSDQYKPHTSHRPSDQSASTFLTGFPGIFPSCLGIKQHSSSSQTTSFMWVKGRLFWCTTVWSRCSPLAVIGAGASQFCLIPHQNTFGMLIAYLLVFNGGWLPKTRFNNFKKRRDDHPPGMKVVVSCWDGCEGSVC